MRRLPRSRPTFEPVRPLEGCGEIAIFTTTITIITIIDPNQRMTRSARIGVLHRPSSHGLPPPLKAHLHRMRTTTTTIIITITTTMLGPLRLVRWYPCANPGRS
jgi:hypothetical protein